MISELIKIANLLDEKGLTEYSDRVEKIAAELQKEAEEKMTSSKKAK